jgi:hypothetical protein
MYVHVGRTWEEVGLLGELLCGHSHSPDVDLTVEGEVTWGACSCKDPSRVCATQASV